MGQRQPAQRGIGLHRQIDGTALGLDTQYKVRGKLRSKEQRRALGWQHQIGFLGAETLRRIHRMQRRRLDRAHRRQRHHHHGLGVAEGGRHVQPQVQRIFGGQGQRGNVLVMRRVQGAEDLDGIHDGANIRAVGSAASHRRIAELAHQVRGGVAGKLCHGRLHVSVVQHQAVGVAHQAGRLLIGGLVEAFMVELDAQAAGGHLGAHLQGFGVRLGGNPNFRQIGIQAHPVPTGHLQILNGANKNAGAANHGLAQRAEVAARLRRQKDQRLLRLFRHRHEDSLLAHVTVPGLHAGKPVRGRRVGGSAQKGDNQDIMRGLALGKIGVNPEPVSRQQVGNLADGQRNFATLHMHVHLGSGQIEGGAIGVQIGRNQAQEQEYLQIAAHILYCTELAAIKM